MDLSSFWGTPGVADVGRTALAQATASWGLPGFINDIIPVPAQPSPVQNVAKPPPAMDPGSGPMSGVANVPKLDGQPEAGFMSKYGRMVAIGGGILAVVLLAFTFLRRK